MKTNAISNVGAITSSGTTSNGGTYTDFVTSRTTNSNLTLSANGTGLVTTGNSAFWVNSTVTGVDSAVMINGPSTGNSRYVGCYQNGTYKLSFGLAASSHFFVYDGVNSKDLFKALTSGFIQFPQYTTDGTLTVSGGAGLVVRTSDRRLKKNEAPLVPSESLQKLMTLQPKRYSWKADTDRARIGFIAQDVEQVIPEAVDGKKFEYEFVRDGASEGVEGTVRTDEEGNPVLDQDRPRYRGLDQCAILSVVVSAMQALVQRNIELENRIIDLEEFIDINMPNKRQRT
jgi:hypothetical protein